MLAMAAEQAIDLCHETVALHAIIPLPRQ